MKKVRRIIGILVFLFVVAVYLNIGYYGGKCFNSANTKLLSGNGQLNLAETAIVGPDGEFVSNLSSIGISVQQIYEKKEIVLAFSMLFWPIGALLSLTGWLVFSAIGAINAIWWFFFKEGLFQLLAKLPFYIYAPVILIGLFLSAYLVKKRFRKKPKTGTEINKENQRRQ